MVCILKAILSWCQNQVTHCKITRERTCHMSTSVLRRVSYTSILIDIVSARPRTALSFYVCPRLVFCVGRRYRFSIRTQPLRKRSPRDVASVSQPGAGLEDCSIQKVGSTLLDDCDEGTGRKWVLGTTAWKRPDFSLSQKLKVPFNLIPWWAWRG